MNWQTLFNPFSKFSERTLLIFGLLTFSINSLVCYFTKNEMNSIFHFSPNENLTILSAFVYCALSIIFAVAVLYILALIFNSKTRLIDIVNTVLISQFPNFILLLFTKFSGMDEMAAKLSKSIDKTKPTFENYDLLLLSVFSFFILWILIYGFILIFNGFKTATNMKKWRQIIVFITILFFFILICQLTLPLLNI